MLLTTNDLEIWTMFKNGKADVSVDELADRFPGYTRHALNLRMRYLSQKMAPEGWIIRRVSGLGRGVRGVYRAEKKF